MFEKIKFKKIYIYLFIILERTEYLIVQYLTWLHVFQTKVNPPIKALFLPVKEKVFLSCVSLFHWILLCGFFLRVLFVVLGPFKLVKQCEILYSRGNQERKKKKGKRNIYML